MNELRKMAEIFRKQAQSSQVDPELHHLMKTNFEAVNAILHVLKDMEEGYHEEFSPEERRSDFNYIRNECFKLERNFQKMLRVYDMMTQNEATDDTI